MEGLMWIICLIINVILLKSSTACGPSEYRIHDECCPMCSPGYRVHKDCTEFTSTSCAPCIGSTYTDRPSGLIACKSCTHCDPGFGLMVKQPCSPSSDTVCEPLEGFYCTEPTKDGCKVAQRHSSCKPGQYIREKGTPSTDTMCSNCTGETYSDGSFTSCQPHTQSDTLKLQQTNGSQISPLITAVISAIIFIVGVVALALIGIAVYEKHEGFHCKNQTRRTLKQVKVLAAHSSLLSRWTPRNLHDPQEPA
ncbi:hypothetical protein DPEC_G00014700 [Dallia pectoralis]|uniref:Uncharacterized protein n=1 Tax=Dallia pectoralis TaxID=75939 RepID=A0ACC2HM85_DALPE|nr:hypothetical protein DPEC_G00014700 [Dallia pectoralis]